MLLRPFDFCVAVTALAVVIASFFLVYANADDRPAVHLKGSSGEWVFPVDATETINVSGPLGDTVVEITGNSARIVASPCLNQTCVAARAVRSSGQWAACLPNRVMLYIGEGENKNDVDATAW